MKHARAHLRACRCRGAAALLGATVLAAACRLPPGARERPPVSVPAAPEMVTETPALPVARVRRVNETHRFVILESFIPLRTGDEGVIYHDGTPAVTVSVRRVQGRIAAAVYEEGAPRKEDRVRFHPPPGYVLPPGRPPASARRRARPR